MSASCLHRFFIKCRDPLGWSACLLLAVALLTACAAPRQHILRLDMAPCPHTDGGSAPVPEAPLISFRTLDSLASLNRTAVLLAKGSVLTPSQQWVLEGTPATLLTQAIRNDLVCNGAVRLALPESLRARPAWLLSGQVVGFEIRTDPSPHFRAALQLALYTGDTRLLAAQRFLEADMPIAALDEQSVAQAGAAATGQLALQATAWVAEMTQDAQRPLRPALPR